MNSAVKKPLVNKQGLLALLCAHLQQDIDATMAAVNEAHALASHEQSKPENQYDTLALEAAYLAHGQSERIAELQRQLMLLNHFEFSDYDEDSRISVGAVVCLEDLTQGAEGELQWLWILPVAGGIALKCEDLNKLEQGIRTITPEAPLAEKLMGSHVGEELELQLGHKKKQFEIIELL